MLSFCDECGSIMVLEEKTGNMGKYVCRNCKFMKEMKVQKIELLEKISPQENFPILEKPPQEI